MLKPFECTKCGACCRHMQSTAETSALDRGDGICMHYDDATKNCKIYETRPDMCNIEKLYAKTYAQDYSWDTFCALNHAGCLALQEQERTK